MKGKAMGSLPLERYIDFYNDPSRCSISLPHLKQIIVMHGFQHLHNRKKKHYVECLASIELMPPMKSTLEEGVSSSVAAFMSADEVASDLADLGWQECQIQSIVTFDPRSGAQGDWRCDLESPAANDGVSSPAELPPRSGRVRRIRTPPVEFVVSGKRPRSKRRCISINALAGLASAFHPAAAAASAVPPEATPHEEAASHVTRSPIRMASPPESPYLPSPPSSSSWTMSSASSSPPSSPLSWL